MRATSPIRFARGLQIAGRVTAVHAEVLTAGALSFLDELVARFAPRWRELEALARKRQEAIDGGELPGFPPEMCRVRDAAWSVAPLPEDLLDRRVELVGSPAPGSIITGSNAGARAFVADFEEGIRPVWTALLDAQINLRDAVNHTLRDTTGGRRRELADDASTLMLRPRALSRPESNVLAEGEPVPAGLIDFGLFFFHNGRNLIGRGSGPYVYLPGVKGYLEARLWNEVFAFSQDALHVPRGTIKATVILDTLPAAFEMDEILWELREHSAGLAFDPGMYLASFIRCLGQKPDCLLPDWRAGSDPQPFLAACERLLVQTCHRRGVHAIKLTRSLLGHPADAAVGGDGHFDRGGYDGTLLADVRQVPTATAAFDSAMPGPNRIAASAGDPRPVTTGELLQVRHGPITMNGLETNVSAALRYTESWLAGQGSLAIGNLLEDAATAEISRAQLWQWMRHPMGVLEDGRRVTVELFREVLAGESRKLRGKLGADQYAARKFKEAAELLDRMVTGIGLPAFLTLEAYGRLA